MPVRPSAGSDSSGRLGVAHVAAAVALAATVSACDGGTTGRSTIIVGPSALANAVTVSVAPLPPAFGWYVCAVGTPFTQPLNVVVTTRTFVRVDRVALQLIGSSGLGGSTVAFPSSQLTAQFGSLGIPAGATREFGLRPQFVCAPQPWTVRATVVVVDGAGSTHTVDGSGSI